MEEENKTEETKVDRLVGNVIECAETRIDLMAINIQDKVTEVLASMASVAVIMLLLGLVVLLLSIGAAMYVSEYFNSSFIGFLYVGAFYFVVALVIFFARKSLIKLPIINALLKKINFHEED